MQNLQKGFIAPLLLVTIILLLVGGGAYMYMQRKQVNQPVAESPVTQVTSTTPTSILATLTTTTSAKASQLAIDLSTVTPQFIDDGGDGKYKDGTPLPDYMIKIKNDIAAIFAPASQDGYYLYSRPSNIVLFAIGERYVFFGDIRAKESGSDKILDSVTQTSTETRAFSIQLFKTDEIAVYVSPQNVCTYTLDQPSCVPLAGADLSGEEFYFDPMGGFWIEETHTDTSLTIGVFDRESPLILDPNTGSLLAKKLRDATFVLPPSSISSPRKGAALGE